MGKEKPWLLPNTCSVPRWTYSDRSHTSGKSRQKLCNLLMMMLLLLNVAVIKARLYAQETKVPKTDLNLPKMVFVEGGKFVMGKESLLCMRDPHYTVILDDYFISEAEITNQQFATFLNHAEVAENLFWVHCYLWNSKMPAEFNSRIYLQNGSFRVEKGYENYPVNAVSWYGAKAYCNWISKVIGRLFQLPSDAQWEFAANNGNRGYLEDGKAKGYWQGLDKKDSLTFYAWYVKNADNQLHPVKTKLPNLLGLYDMMGNVGEWVEDGESLLDFDGDTLTNPIATISKKWRFFRGGCGVHDDLPHREDVIRLVNEPIRKTYFIGFRVAYTSSN